MAFAALTFASAILSVPLSLLSGPNKVQALDHVNQGDGVLFYAANSNTNPQFRTYTESTNDFSSNSGTVSNAQPYFTYIRNSPTKFESIAGYQDDSGNLHVLCYDGSSWTEDWSVAVTASGTPTTRAFAIAYENNSGDATVAYSRNTVATNALAYRTKSGSSGCGSANWSSASNFPTGTSTTTGAVQWVKATRDGRSGKDLQAWIWADSNSDLGGAIWDGSQFTNFKLLETSLEVVTSAQDVDDFELQYESVSGDLMVVWANSGGTNGTNGVRYNTCTGGTSSCTWSASALNPNTGTGDDATSLDLAANPLTDEMVFASIGNAGADLQQFYWSGSAWTIHANQDTACETPGAGMKLVTVGWLTNNGNTKWYLSYDDSAGTGISWYYGSGTAAPTKPADFTSSPSINDIRERYDTDMNPFNNAELIQTVTDSTSVVFAFKLSMDTSGNLSWSNMASASSLGSLPAVPQKGFDFQYWRYIPPVPDAPVLYSDDGGSNQIAFNNIKQSSATPMFRASATSPSSFNRFQIELNTAADFSGTAYTETFSGSYSSSTAYNLQTTGSLGLPTTDGVTYYARIRASIDGGSFWGDWSSGTWSYTYSSSGSPKWFQSATDQFNSDSLSGTLNSNTDSVSLNNIPMSTQSAWTSLYAGTAFPGTYSYTVNSGTDRLLVVGVASDITASATQTASVTYNGVSLTKQITDESTNDRQHTWLFYLKDNAVMDGTAHNLVVTVTGGTASRNFVYAAVYAGVDQSTPITDSQNFNGGTSTGTAVGPFSSALTINSGDTAVEMASVYRSGSTTARTISTWATNWSSALGPNSGNDGTNSGSAYAATNGTSGTTTSQHTANAAALRSMSAMSLKWDGVVQSSGTIMSPEIDFDSVPGQVNWGSVSFSTTETSGDVKLKVYYTASTACDTIVPNGVLPGNSSGFDVSSSPVDLSGLTPVASTYNKICLQATLTGSIGSPSLDDWTVDWMGSGPSPPTTDQCLRGCEYFSGGSKQPFYWAN